MMTRPNILVVDDRPDNLSAVRYILSDVDAEIITAESGGEALALMMKHEFALVILDVMMPLMDGYEVASLMREREETRTTPIIFATANNQAQEHEFKGYRSGAIDYLYKPIEPLILESKVNLFLEFYRQRKQIELKNEELEAFASIAAHDLRAPLGQVQLFCESLQADNQDKHDHKSKGDCQRILNSMARMTRLVDDLLGYARCGEGDEALVPVDLDTLTAGVVSSLGVEIREADARVMVGPLPTVSGHETGLTQLIQNLLANAIKFRGVPAPLVEVSAECQGDMWQVTVKDNGIGIDPDQHETIFAAFRRLHPAREYPGTGLGLATCCKVVERLGGRIWVESEPGAGTTFHFTVAAAATLPEDERVAPRQTVPDEQAGTSGGPLRQNRRVLIAEDDDSNQHLLQRVMAQVGGEACFAENGALAVAMIEKAQAEGRPFALVLMDMWMPVMDGFEATRKLRTQGFEMPIVALTSGALGGDRQKCIEAGCTDYETKPISNLELIRLIGRYTLSVPAGR